MDDDKIVQTVCECLKESEQSRRSRIKQNRTNWQMYLGQQDWSHKLEDQSTEFLPKVSNAVEQMAAFVKRGLIGMGDWFSVEVGQNSPIDGNAVRTVLSYFLQKIYVSQHEHRDFGTIISDAVKMGLMESLVTLKIHGCYITENFTSIPTDQATGVTANEPEIKQRRVWKLRVDVVPADEFYIDPTGMGLYKIHRVEKDLYEIQQKAKEGYYDQSIVNQIAEDVRRMDADKKRESEKNQDESPKPMFRKKIVIDEFWGTLLNEDGSVYKEHVCCTVANEKFLLKKPQPFPFWHGEDPFVSAPLIRVPQSVWHKAVYDNASNLNMALNELYNLMFDGAMAATWGIRQLHADWLEDTGQVSNGVPPGTTLILAPGVPPDAKALESVFTTSVPPEALQMFQLTDREFQASAMTNDVRLGQFSQRNIKATEVMASNQQSDMTLDSVMGDLENEVIEKALRKIWLTLLQNVGKMAPADLVDSLGIDASFALSRLTAAERYKMLADQKFKVMGLSATMAKAGDFQKMMALMQIIGTNPLLLQSFFQKFSPDKVLDAFLKFLNINPDSIAQSQEEQLQQPQKLQQLQQLMQQMGMNQNGTTQANGNGGSMPGIGGNGGSLGADSGLNGEIHQNANPTGGY